MQKKRENRVRGFVLTFFFHQSNCTEKNHHHRRRLCEQPFIHRRAYECVVAAPKLNPNPNRTESGLPHLFSELPCFLVGGRGGRRRRRRRRGLSRSPSSLSSLSLLSSPSFFSSPSRLPLPPKLLLKQKNKKTSKSNRIVPCLPECLVFWGGRGGRRRRGLSLSSPSASLSSSLSSPVSFEGCSSSTSTSPHPTSK